MSTSSTTTLAQSLTAPQQFFYDDKWRLSKKEGLGASRSMSRSSSSKSITPLMMKSASVSSSSSSTSSTSQRRCSFTRKCARLVKEQRARFYIMRRCVTMLICWSDS